MQNLLHRADTAPQHLKIHVIHNITMYDIIIEETPPIFTNQEGFYGKVFGCLKKNNHTYLCLKEVTGVMTQ